MTFKYFEGIFFKNISIVQYMKSASEELMWAGGITADQAERSWIYAVLSY